MTEAYSQDEDESSWRTDKPGEKTGNAASNDERPEPKKYKGLWRKFGSEIRKKIGK